jgi:hypothetical protein
MRRVELIVVGPSPMMKFCCAGSYFRGLESVKLNGDWKFVEVEDGCGTASPVPFPIGRGSEKL